MRLEPNRKRSASEQTARYESMASDINYRPFQAQQKSPRIWKPFTFRKARFDPNDFVPTHIKKKLKNEGKLKNEDRE